MSILERFFKRQGPRRIWAMIQPSICLARWLKNFDGWQPSQKFSPKMFDFCISIELHALTNFGMGFNLSASLPTPPQASHAYTGVIPRAFFRFKVEVEDLTTNAATAHGWSERLGDVMSEQATNISSNCSGTVLKATYVFSILSLLNHRSRLYWNAWHDMLMWFC